MSEQVVAVASSSAHRRRAYRALAMRRGPLMTIVPIVILDVYVLLGLLRGSSLAQQQPLASLALIATVVVAYILLAQPFVTEVLTRRSGLRVGAGDVRIDTGNVRLPDGSNARFRDHVEARDLDVLVLIRAGRRVVLPVPRECWNSEQHRLSVLAELGAGDLVNP